jgi:hypothetical protein
MNRLPGCRRLRARASSASPAINPSSLSGAWRASPTAGRLPIGRRARVGRSGALSPGSVRARPRRLPVLVELSTASSPRGSKRLSRDRKGCKQPYLAVRESVGERTPTRRPELTRAPFRLPLSARVDEDAGGKSWIPPSVTVFPDGTAVAEGGAHDDDLMGGMAFSEDRVLEFVAATARFTQAACDGQVHAGRMGSDRQARRHPQRGRRARVAGRVDEGLAIAHVVAQRVDELGRAGSFNARCSGRRLRRRSRRARCLRHDATARARSLAILHRCRTCPVARSRLGAERENSPRTAPSVKGDRSTSAPPRPGGPGRVLRRSAPGGRGVQSSCRATRPSPARPRRTCGSPRRRAPSAVRLRGRRLHSRRRCRTGKSVRVRHGPRHCDQGARTPRCHWAHRAWEGKAKSARPGSQETACIVV